MKKKLRLDVYLKKLYFDFLQDKHRGALGRKIQENYKLHIFHRTRGVEPKDYQGQDINKNSITDYRTSCSVMLQDMRKNGYNPKFPIPLNYKGELLNGAHRLACAKSLGLEPFFLRVENVLAPVWDEKWFLINGYSEKFISHLVFEALQEIVAKNIYIFWDHRISNKASQLLEEKGIEHYGLEFNLPVDERLFVESIYSLSLQPLSDELLVHKAKIIQNKKVYICVVDGNCDDSLKSMIRCNLSIFSDQKDIFDIVHAPDTQFQHDLIISCLFPPFSMDVGSKDILLNLTDKKIQLLAEAYSIEMDKVVVGSFPLALFTKINPTDLDLVIPNYERKEEFAYQIRDGIDVVNNGYLTGVELIEDGKLNDNDLIYNDKYYYTFAGIKMLKSDLIVAKKKHDMRPTDLKSLQVYEKYISDGNVRTVDKTKRYLRSIIVTAQLRLPFRSYFKNVQTLRKLYLFIQSKLQ